MTIKKAFIILLHALLGWVLCGATIYICKMITTEQNTLIIHAILAPIYFAALSIVYFRRFNFTKPIVTAVVFVSIIMILDFLVVGLLINRSPSMFESLLGTWIPFALIFVSTFLTSTICLMIKNRTKLPPSSRVRT